MPTFVSTVSFTDQGRKNFKETCKRAAAFKTLAATMNVQVRETFWTMGPFDGLVIFDAPDEEAAAAVMLQLESFGNVQTQTARAYRADEMESILGKMSP